MSDPEVLANRHPEGPDFPRRGLAERATAVALLAILGVGAWQAISAIATPQAHRRLTATLNVEALLGGRTAAAVNHVMAHDLPMDGVLRAAGGVLRWVVFGSGGPQVWPGCAGWLYLTEELRPWPGGETAMARRAALLAGVSQRLADQGIALRVVVVPDKSRMLPGLRCGAPYSAQAEARLAGFGAALSNAGVAQVDIAPALAEAAAWYRTDTHWNQYGARHAAGAIAAAMPEDLARGVQFRTLSASVETNGPGDLLRLMSLDRVPDALRPRPDRVWIETTVAEQAVESDSILDETPVPEVVLVGSSFSVNANFHGALQEALRAPVGNLAKAGGGFAGAVRDYLGSPAWRETPPQLVIWEFPERVLMQPLNVDDAALAAWLNRR